MEYLFCFSVNPKRRCERVVFIDCFPDSRLATDENEAGRAVWRKISQCAGWPNPVKVHLINLERGPLTISTVDEKPHPSAELCKVTNLRGGLHQLASEIESAIADTPAVYFISPDASPPIPFTLLERLLRRPHVIADFIIELDTRKLERALKEPLSKVEIEAVIRLTGTKRWCRAIMTCGLPIAERVDIVISDYRRNLVRQGYRVAIHRIRPRRNSRSDNCILYCTRDPGGLRSMNSWIRSAEDHLLRAFSEKTQTTKLAIKGMRKNESARRRALRTLILDYTRQAKKCSPRRIRRHLLLTRFGDFHDDDFSAVMKKLIEEGSLLPELGGQSVNEQEALHYVSGNSNPICSTRTLLLSVFSALVLLL